VPLPLSTDQVLSLAPVLLENRRASRYRADEQAIASSDLGAVDFATVTALYAMLGELEESGADPSADPAAPLAVAARHDLDGLLQRVRRLGAERSSPRVASAVHDLRGGALTTLFVHLGRLRRLPERADTRRSLLLGARDHRKMMRNVVLDLDATARARDLAFLPHSLVELARTLRAFAGVVRGEPIVVDVESATDAVIAESCVECAAIDRVAYNLMNNAVRHADRPEISVSLRTSDHDLQVTVANAIAPEQRTLVAAKLGRDPAALHGSFTTTGSGQGLQIVSDLVSRAYGVASTEALVSDGYVGAKVLDDLFVTWFHWPLAGA